MRGAAASLLAAGLGVLPRAAEACAVCTGGEGGATQRAFLIGTLLLSTLPLAMIGGLTWFLRNRAFRRGQTPSFRNSDGAER